MAVFIILSILLPLFILFKWHYNRYSSGLREQPSYILWFVTQVINWNGWSEEAYCLRTTDLKTTDHSGYLKDGDIPVRTLSRPKMLRGVPHRQLSQHAPDDIMAELIKHMESISIPRCGGQTLDDNLLLRSKSKLEYTGADGLFLPNMVKKDFGEGEFAHFHANDGSFHMILHPLDAKLLIEKQWAEIFPLAGVNIFNRIKLPASFAFIYAPQNENDLKIWKIILDAAIRYNRDIKNKG